MARPGAGTSVLEAGVLSGSGAAGWVSPRLAPAPAGLGLTAGGAGSRSSPRQRPPALLRRAASSVPTPWSLNLSPSPGRQESKVEEIASGMGRGWEHF